MASKLEFGEVYSLIEEKLEAVGFKAFREFTAVDSLVYKNSPIGFYSLKSSELVNTAVNHSSLELAMEIDCVFQIRLMGNSCDYADYDEFAEMCDKLYHDFIVDHSFLIRKMELGRVFQSLPLKRLARELTVNMRLCLKEDASEWI